MLVRPSLKHQSDTLRTTLKFLEARGILVQGEAESALNRIETTTDLAEAVSSADYVQESVLEKYDLKKDPDEIKAWRDEMLVELLKLIQDSPHN
ncbi:unnamed protein product [marine sediment metagenome]|uniref:3-hydroxyacyl-CoA dehydrogenase NAD binding domain-containing protein n=1 Tax=marine sediment metagenome TaxID=412755 RepID=X0VIL4_9ZZZZ